jgi:hypothetical protein
MPGGIDSSSAYGASQGGYGGLGIGNPGSYGGSNSLGSTSPSSSSHDGSGHTDGDSHSTSSTGYGGFEGLGIGNPGSYCSVADLYSGTPLSPSSEEENEARTEDEPGEVTKTSGMLPCPDKPPINDKNWKSYDETGNPAVFHCGYEGYLEVKEKPSGALTNECFYDEKGDLVDENHPHAACGGTPDEYPPDSFENQIKHTFIDKGGIVRSGGPAFIESREVELEKAKESILNEIKEFENRIINQAVPYDFR